MARNAWLQMYRHEALSEQGGRCAYCKDPLPVCRATADHKWPRSRHGTTTRNNIVAACRECNIVKGDMSHIEFYKLIDRGQRPAPGSSPAIMLVWASRRIWKRTIKACERIERRAR